MLSGIRFHHADSVMLQATGRPHQRQARRVVVSKTRYATQLAVHKRSGSDNVVHSQDRRRNALHVHDCFFVPSFALMLCAVRYAVQDCEH